MSDVTSKLDALRARMQQSVDRGGGSRYKFWYPDAPSRTRIRIMPAVGDMELFWQEVGRYDFPDGTKFTSAFFTTQYGKEDDGVPCPVKDLMFALYKGNEYEKELASKLNSWPAYKEKWWMNIVLRADENDTVGIDGPYIFPAPYTIYQKILTFVLSNDYGDPSDEENGYDLTVVANKNGQRIEYDVIASPHKTPLAPDLDHPDVDILFESAADLKWQMLTDDPDEDEAFLEGKIIGIWSPERVIAETGLSVDSKDQDILNKFIPKQSERNGGGSTRSSSTTSAKEVLRQARQEEDQGTEEVLTTAEVDDVGAAIQREKANKRQRRRR